MKGIVSIILIFAVSLLLASPFGGKSNRIIGGQDAASGQFRHQVSLRLVKNKEKIHFCGGTIIGNYHILTAAHCLDGMKMDDIEIMTGSKTRYKPEMGAGFYGVRNIVIHEDYIPSQMLNDIAILRANTSITMSYNGVFWAETDEVGDNDEVTVSGWGKTIKDTPGGNLPTNNLQFINLKTIDLKTCAEMLPSTYPITENQVCTLTKAGEGTCLLDDGGPLVVKAVKDWKLVGIVSWGIPCAKGFPDVYTRVSKYSAWIDKHNMPR